MKIRGDHRAANNPEDNSNYNRFSCLEDESEGSKVFSSIEEEVIIEKDQPLIIPKKIEHRRKIKRRKQIYHKGSFNTNGANSEIMKVMKDDSSVSESPLNATIMHPINSDVISQDHEDDDYLVNCLQLMPEPLMKVQISIQDIETKALIDTGADTNMIRRSLVNQFRDVEIVGDHKIIRGLGDKDIETAGILNTDFSFYGVHIVKTPFHIVDDDVIKTPVILGKKFCAKAKLIIDMNNRKISKAFNDGSRIDVYLNPEDTNLRTSVHESIKVYAAEEVDINDGINRIMIRYEHELNGLVSNQEEKLYFEGKQSDKLESLDGILAKDTNEPQHIFVKTTGTTSCQKAKIKEGDFLGTISSIVEIDEDSVDESDWSLSKLKNKLDIGENLTQEQKNEVYELLVKLKGSLSKDDNDIGRAQVTPQRIVLTDKTPIWQRPRRVADPLNEEIERQCKELEFHKIIEKCNSPWSSPIVPIRKTDGSLRLCVDYRKVNSVTKAEKFPMPNLNESSLCQI